MDKALKNFLKSLKMNESTVSSALGALVVVVIGVLLFNYFKSQPQTPEISDEGGQTVATSENVELTTDSEGKLVPKSLPTNHLVVAGDHLWAISETYFGNGYNWIDIAEANNISAPYAIEQGMELVIPQVPLRWEKDIVSKAVVTEEVAEAMNAMETTDVMDSMDKGHSGDLLTATSYTVARGDHLWNIALRAYGDGYRWMDVYTANKDKINNPDYIEIGMELTLPR